MAAAAALHVKNVGRPVTALVCSPLERTRQSAEPFTKLFGHEPTVDERVIEPVNVFEGQRMQQALANPLNWRHLVRPSVPSWGEPYVSIVKRMREAIDSAWDAAPDGDVVIVSHQAPIWLTHLSVAGEPLRHDPRDRRCALSSVTSLRTTEAADGSRSSTRSPSRRPAPSTSGRSDARHPPARRGRARRDPRADSRRLHRTIRSPSSTAPETTRATSRPTAAWQEIPDAEPRRAGRVRGSHRDGRAILQRGRRRRRRRGQLLVRGMRAVPRRGRRPRVGVAGVPGPERLVRRRQHARPGRHRAGVRRHLRHHLPERHRRERGVGQARLRQRDPDQRDADDARARCEGRVAARIIGQLDGRLDPLHPRAATRSRRARESRSASSSTARCGWPSPSRCSPGWSPSSRRACCLSSPVTSGSSGPRCRRPAAIRCGRRLDGLGDRGRRVATGVRLGDRADAGGR